MKNSHKYSLFAGCAVGLIFTSNVVMAMPVTATDTYTLSGTGQFMSTTSGPVTHIFDINGFLSSGFSTPYNLSNVSVMATFTDDTDSIIGSNLGTPGPYAWTSGPDSFGGGTQRRTVTAVYTEEQETAALSAGTSSYSGSTTATNGGSYTHSTLDSHTGLGYHSGSCSWGSCSSGYYDSYLNKYTDTTGPRTNYNGPFQINAMLDSTAVADLGVDGMLGVSVSSTVGDFWLQSLSLTFTATPASSQSTAGTGTQLPEPGNMALLGMGLLGMAAYRRRRRS